MINFLKNNKNILARIALFVVFVWFGLLKILDLSPAETVVKNLFYSVHLDSLINFKTFFYYLGWFEILIGFGILINKFRKFIFWLFFIHMMTTFGPAIFDAKHFWNGFGVLTLEGQYIVKNLVLIMLGVYILL